MADLEEEPLVLIEMAKAIHAYDERQYAASSWEELSPAQREQRVGQANAAMRAYGMHNLQTLLRSNPNGRPR